MRLVQVAGVRPVGSAAWAAWCAVPLPRRGAWGNRLHALLDRVEQARALDPVADRLARVVAPATHRAKAHELLSGTWLGHAFHPVLTDFADGAWMAASFLDLFGRQGAAAPARRLVGFGLAAAVPTALTGLAEWAGTAGERRRVGVVHAATSSAAFVLYGYSYLARRSRRQRAGVALGVAGGIVAIADGYVGGHLSLALGVGVAHTAFEEFPDQWTPTVQAQDLPEGRPVGALLGSTPIVLVRSGARIFALADRCTYRGGRLHQGRLSGQAIVCPRHGCIFDLEDGAVLRGPASIPQPSLQVRVAQGRVEVRAKNREAKGHGAAPRSPS